MAVCVGEKSVLLLNQDDFAVDDVQAVLRLAEALARKIVYGSIAFGEGWGEAFNILNTIRINLTCPESLRLTIERLFS